MTDVKQLSFFIFVIQCFSHRHYNAMSMVFPVNHD